MNNLIRFDLKKSGYSRQNFALKRTAIADVIQLESRKLKKISAEAVRKAVAGGSKNYPDIEITLREIDPGLLDYLERHLSGDEITSIESGVFTKTPEYQKLREFLKSLNTQMFSTYLLQSKIEKLTPPQIQAILDEIDERG